MFLITTTPSLPTIIIFLLSKENEQDATDFDLQIDSNPQSAKSFITGTIISPKTKSAIHKNKKCNFYAF